MGIKIKRKKKSKNAYLQTYKKLQCEIKGQMTSQQIYKRYQCQPFFLITDYDYQKIQRMRTSTSVLVATEEKKWIKKLVKLELKFLCSSRKQFFRINDF